MNGCNATSAQVPNHDLQQTLVDGMTSQDVLNILSEALAKQSEKLEQNVEETDNVLQPQVDFN